MSDLAGKVALVTGGSRGIGAAVAMRLAQQGADVALTYANDERAAGEVCSAIRALDRRAEAIRADSGNAGEIEAAVHRTARELRRLDILVSNAGIFPYGPLEELSGDEIDRTFAIHTSGVLLAARAALGYMGDGGRIVSIGSCFVDRVPVAGITLYAMSKSALMGFTKGLARDVGGRGITVNVVHPGPTDTDMNPANSPEADEERALTALGRYGEGADIAATVAHLAGPGGRYITGTSIAVDGGYSA